ncbi:MAG: hypothetical protein ACFFFC_20450 [Candidatus Thorarchaeota archaeon]
MDILTKMNERWLIITKNRIKVFENHGLGPQGVHSDQFFLSLGVCKIQQEFHEIVFKRR